MLKSGKTFTTLTKFVIIIEREFGIVVKLKLLCYNFGAHIEHTYHLRWIYVSQNCDLIRIGFAHCLHIISAQCKFVVVEAFFNGTLTICKSVDLLFVEPCGLFSRDCFEVKSQKCVRESMKSVTFSHRIMNNDTCITIFLAAAWHT